MTTTTKHGMPPMTAQELSWLIDGLGELHESLSNQAADGDTEDGEATFAEADAVQELKRRMHTFARMRGIRLG